MNLWFRIKKFQEKKIYKQLFFKKPSSNSISLLNRFDMEVGLEPTPVARRKPSTNWLYSIHKQLYHHLCTLDNVVYERVLLNYTTYIDILMLTTHQSSILTITNCFAQRSDSNWHHRCEAVCFHYTTFANTNNITSYIDVYRVLWYACFALLLGLEPRTLWLVGDMRFELIREVLNIHFTI